MQDVNAYIGFRVQLYPTDEQKQLIHQYFGAVRFAYNYAIEEELKSKNMSNKFLSKYTLNKIFTKFKHLEQNSWLLRFDSTSLKVALFDAVDAFKRFFRGLSGHPRFKSKKTYHQSMPIRSDRLKIFAYKMQISGLGLISISHIPNSYIIGHGDRHEKTNPELYRHYIDARLIYDGYKYWCAFSLEKNNSVNTFSVLKRPNYESIPQSDIVGIDLGCKGKNWIVDSNGNRVSLPCCDKEHKKLKRLHKKLDRQVAQSRTKTGIVSKRRQKTIIQINKYYSRIRNKKQAKIYDYTSHCIVDLKPKAVVLEDLRVADMLCDDKNIPYKNRCIYNSKILDASLYMVQTIISRTCASIGIPVIKANRQFPSSQRCSTCGHIQKIGSRKLYRCPNCGLSIDRDANAAKNLAMYPNLNFSV